MQATVIANTITNPPIAYPEVAVGGENFNLRFTLASSFFLENQCDIPAQELTSWIDQQVSKKHISAMLMTMSASMLGKTVDGKWKPMPITPQELATRCTPDEWSKIMAVYTEAMSKAAAAVKEAIDKMAPVAPPQTTEPVN